MRLGLLAVGEDGHLVQVFGEPRRRFRDVDEAVFDHRGLRVQAQSFLLIGRAHFFSRRFDEAVPKLLLAIQEDQSSSTPYRFLAACYAHLGRLDDAREIVARLRAITSVVVPSGLPYRKPEDRELYLSRKQPLPRSLVELLK